MATATIEDSPVQSLSERHQSFLKKMPEKLEKPLNELTNFDSVYIDFVAGKIIELDAIPKELTELLGKMAIKVIDWINYSLSGEDAVNRVVSERMANILRRFYYTQYNGDKDIWGVDEYVHLDAWSAYPELAEPFYEGEHNGDRILSLEEPFSKLTFEDHSQAPNVTTL